jgi:hypothetical protein
MVQRFRDAAEHPSSPTQIGEGIWFVRRGGAWIFPECIHNACGVDKRCPGIDASRNPECFRNLFLGRAMLDRGLRMHRNAAVAAQRDGDRESDEFSDFRAEQNRSRSCRLKSSLAS